MLKYILGLLKLYKIRFDIEDCYDIYFLEYILGLFMQAEGKKVEYIEYYKFVTPKPIGKPWIVSKLPQFSERINKQIKKVRAFQDSQLSKIRVIKNEQLQNIPEFGKFGTTTDSFIEKNESLFLTYPKLNSNKD